MKIMKLKPFVADNIWGGTRLIEEYGIETDKRPAAEAWVLSCHPSGPSFVENGEYEGKTLEEVFKLHPEIAGENAKGYENFPVLIKFIDAKRDLSIQVHPDDEYAMRVEGEYGKTEAWYILDCDEDAQLILGFKKDITAEEFKKAAQSEEILDIVNKIKVKKGDVFFIKAGTLHAICKGILLAEVQQNSNTTYRAYDYGRLGADGKPRELHLNKAADVVDLCPPSIPDLSKEKTEDLGTAKRKKLAECDIFTFWNVSVSEKYEEAAGKASFVSLLCSDGEGVISIDNEEMPFKKGESIFIPANSGKFTFTGKAEIIETRLPAKKKPTKVLQIGEGNFLRAFADYSIQQANDNNIFNSSVVVVQPNGNEKAELLNKQNCRYNVLVRGKKDGKLVESIKEINCIEKCINPKTDFDKVLDTACIDSLEVVISNTTEAGIAYNKNDRFNDMPPAVYPAKLTRILYERFKKFSGDKNKGLLILPCELIDNNGTELKKTVLKYAEEWKLEKAFAAWVENSNCFADTLVDRIVTGYIKEEAEKHCADDKFFDTCEPFMFWAIKCPQKWRERFPLDKAGLNIIYTDDISAYKKRKVRILNGSHTLSVLCAYLSGYNTVYEMMCDKSLRQQIKSAMYKEIVPTINLPEAELSSFCNDVIERFDNPFIKHKLLDISLNSISKYAVRCLETAIDYYEKYKKAPKVLLFGLASLIVFYNGEFEGERYYGNRNGEKYEIRDSKENLQFIYKAWQSENPVGVILANEKFWGRDLNLINGFYKEVKKDVDNILTFGMKKAQEELMK